MIHMIFELFVSSARISAYISDIPGACAVIGIAASNKKHTTHAHSFPTVPPKFFQESLNHLPSRTSIYARPLLQAMRPVHRRRSARFAPTGHDASPKLARDFKDSLADFSSTLTRFRTQRAGRLSSVTTNLNGPDFGSSASPFIVSATITSPE